MAFENVEEVGARHLHILWTNADRQTSEKMVFMYSENSLKNGWWDKATVIVWGATQKLLADDPELLARMHELQALGVDFSACLTCSNKLGLTELLEGEGVETVRWGKKLTDLLQNGKHLLSI